MLKKYMQKLKKDQRGLTLVELLAVVVILAIVAAIAFVVIGNVIDNTKKDAHVSNAQQIISAVKVAEASGDINFDKETGFVKIIGNTTANGNTKKDLESIGKPVDPWNKVAYTEASVKRENGNYYIKLQGQTTGTNVQTKCNLNPTEGVSETKLQEGRASACQ